MSQIKLKHSGGNGVIIAAPSSNPASDRTITLPSDADGTLARTLDVAFKSYAIIGDKKDGATAGGSITAGDWRTHDLQTEFSDPDGIVSISSNQFTLQAGSYFVTHKSVFFHTNSGVTKLYNVTDGADVSNSFSVPIYARNASTHAIQVTGSVRFTISGEKTFELRARSAIDSSIGFGVASTFADNHYAIIDIFKEV